MENCLFCKIIAGSIPSSKVWEDEICYAFRDIAPQAPTHVLVVPKAHIESCNGITADNSAVVAHIFEVIPQIAKAEGLEGGYRVVSNCGADAGQTVHHLHFHILAARPWHWKWLNIAKGEAWLLPFFLDFPAGAAYNTDSRKTNKSSGSRMHPAESGISSPDP